MSNVIAIGLRGVLEISLLLLAFNFIAFAQSRAKRYEIKPELTSVLLVRDPNCPLQLLQPSPVFGYETGAVLAEYNLQNTSDADVESFEQYQINWLNNETRTARFDLRREDGWVLAPMMTFSSLADSEPFDLVEVNKKTADRLGFSSGRNRILILMIVKVKLSDGRIYDASKQLKKLEKFLDAIEFDGATQEEVETHQQRVRDLVPTLFSKPAPPHPTTDK